MAALYLAMKFQYIFGSQKFNAQLRIFRGETPPKLQIIWIGRENHLDWQGNERF
jgi:hypothetical protein